MAAELRRRHTLENYDFSIHKTHGNDQRMCLRQAHDWCERPGCVHLTRGFISMMTMSPFSGLMAICNRQLCHSQSQLHSVGAADRQHTRAGGWQSDKAGSMRTFSL